MKDGENPFERYELDPREGPRGITERMKELAEDARTDAERQEIRAAWEELTLHKDRRLRAALLAHPESRAPLGAPPPLPRAPGDALSAAALELADLVGLPTAAEALGLSARSLEDSSDSAPLASDPALLFHDPPSR